MQTHVAVVIEDDPDLQQLVASILRASAFEVTVAPDARTALELVEVLKPSLITLDLGLPDIDGLELCRHLRTLTEAYIVILTSRSEQADLLVGLERGADDYITKPFSVLELRARVAALMRRPRALNALAPHVQLSVADLVLDPSTHQVTARGELVNLTRTEFELLHALIGQPGRVRSYRELLGSVWGDEWISDQHLLQVHVGNLRRKLRDRTSVELRSVRGVGYALDPV